MSEREHRRALDTVAREFFAKLKWSGPEPEWSLRAIEIFGAPPEPTPRARAMTPAYGIPKPPERAR